MKLLSKEIINGKPVLTVEKTPSRNWGFWTTSAVIDKYEATRETCKGYWEWVKLPNRLIVPDSMSFQLDSWNRNP